MMNAATPTQSPKDLTRLQILERAASLFCTQGYGGTSMAMIASACGITKAGIYHHFESKEALLADIMDYGMTIFEDQVLSGLMNILDPVERLRECMRRNVLLCTRGWSREITVILHETSTLRADQGHRINERKKKYVQFLERSIADAIAQGKFRKVDPTVAAFSFLGTVLWIYKWFRSNGRLTDEQVAEGMIDIFVNGLLVK